MREMSYQVLVIPTKVGIQSFWPLRRFWIPAFAGMTGQHMTGVTGGFYRIILSTIKIRKFKYYNKKLIIYFAASSVIIIARIILIIFAGINFCNLAPQYMPAKPPAPNSAPSAQSGLIARPVCA